MTKGSAENQTLVLMQTEQDYFKLNTIQNSLFLHGALFDCQHLNPALRVRVNELWNDVCDLLNHYIKRHPLLPNTRVCYRQLHPYLRGEGMEELEGVVKMAGGKAKYRGSEMVG